MSPTVGTPLALPGASFAEERGLVGRTSREPAGVRADLALDAQAAENRGGRGVLMCVPGRPGDVKRWFTRASRAVRRLAALGPSSGG